MTHPRRAAEELVDRLWRERIGYVAAVDLIAAALTRAEEECKRKCDEGDAAWERICQDRVTRAVREETKACAALIEKCAWTSPGDSLGASWYELALAKKLAAAIRARTQPEGEGNG